MLDIAKPAPVSLIIVNHNAGPLLTDCVNTSLNQVKEIILVDNASTDDSLRLLLSRIQDESKLKIIREKRNLGFAAACNIGIEAAREQFLFFLNPDCTLEPGTVARLVEVFTSQTRVGMAGGLLISPDGSEQGGGRRVVPTPWRSFVRAFGLNRLSHRWPNLFTDFHQHKQPLPGGPIEVEAISGACMLVSRAAIEEVGELDEGYFLHCEDLDWCMRFRHKEWKVLFVPDTKIIHDQGTCSRSKPIFVAWQKHKGMIRYYRKFFRHQYPRLLMWAVICGVWIRFAGTAAYYFLHNAWRKIGTKDARQQSTIRQ